MAPAQSSASVPFLDQIGKSRSGLDLSKIKRPAGVSLTELLGTNWLPKLGITLLVLGVALLGAANWQRVPPVGRVFIFYVLGLGILGRETYNYSPTEGRNTSGWLTSDVNNSTSFGGTSLWSGPYFTLRDIFNTSNVLGSASSTQFSDAQKNAVRGFLHTTEAYSILQLINTRNDLGVVVQVNTDPNKLSPFVSRDSAFNYIVGELNKAVTELSAAGTTAFPFTFHSGYSGFTTPANYIKFNRSLAARVNAYRASLGTSGCGAARSATCYQTVLTNLSQSFLDTTKALTLGVFQVYSAAAGDVANTNSNAAT